MGERGPKANWFRERCAEILDQEKLVEFVGRVASGKELEQKPVVVRDGKESHIEIATIPAAISDRLQAFKLLAEWGVGKPIQMVLQLGNEQAAGLMADKAFELMVQVLKRPQTALPISSSVDSNGRNGVNGHS